MAFYINGRNDSGRNDSHELFLFNLLYGKNALARTFAWKLNCSEEKPEDSEELLVVDLYI